MLWLDPWCTFSMGNCFPHDIVIFPLGYKLQKKSQLVHTYVRCSFLQHNIHL